MTPQQIDAMKLALEALKNNKLTHLYCEDTWYSCPKHEDGCANEAQGDECNCGADEINAEFDKSITALEEVLKEHAMQEVQRLGQEIEQEPVIGKWSLREVYFDEDGEPISHRSPPQRTEQPAQRTWVGLTEQDLDYLCNLAYTGDEEFALAVQAKLMEKNA